MAAASRLRVIGCAAVAVAFTGCSNDARAFQDLASLAQSVADAGVPCDAVEPKKGSELVRKIGSCKGSEVTLYLFDDEQAIDDWKKVGPLATPTAVGPNWAATGEREAVERIAEGLDGEMSPGVDR